MRIRYTHINTAGSQPVRLHPLMLLGVIFAVIGLVFAILGGVFLAVGSDALPQLFSSGALRGDVPDALALPVCGLIFGGVGLLFLVTGAVMLLILRRQRRLREELEQYGTRVTGMVTDITVDRTYQVNGRYPLRVLVRAEHPFTREEQTLRSGPVWETSLSPGDPVDVLFDPQDARKHVIRLP